MEPSAKTHPHDPLWRKPWWVQAHWAALAWVALLIYGTLLPFDFQLQRLPAGASGLWAPLALLTAPTWLDLRDPYLAREAASDVVTNLLLFMPAGALVARWLRRRGVGGAGNLAGTSALLLALAWCVESAQSLIPQRIASVQDALLNAAGGALGAAAGEWVFHGVRGGVFGVYRLIAPLLPRLDDLALRVRRRKMALSLVIALNVLGIAGWYALSTPRVTAAPGANLVPFSRHLALSYSDAAVWLGRSLLVYCVIGTLMAVRLICCREEGATLKLLLGAGVAAAVVEWLRRWRYGVGGDATELLLALAAALLVVSTAALLMHLVRLSCRRRESYAVDIDRRRKPHDYRFAIRR